MMFLLLAISYSSATISHRQLRRYFTKSKYFLYWLYLTCLAVVQGWVGKPFCRDRASLSLCESIQIIKTVSLISGPLIVIFSGEQLGACRLEAPASVEGADTASHGGC